MKLADVAPRKEKVRMGDGACCPRNFRDTCPPTLKDARLILVGEAPGKTEVKKQEGFVGRSGKILRKRLHIHGITSYALTNIVKCRPPEDRDPSAACIDACMGRTAEEVEGYEVVALIGNTAINAFFPDQTARKMRGHAAYHPDYPGQRFFCMYHPAWVLHPGRIDKQEKKRRFDQHISRLARLLNSDGPAFQIVTPDDENFHDLLSQSLGRDRIALDIETNHSLRSWQPSSRMTSFSLTADGKTALFCDEDDPVFPVAQEKVSRWLADDTHEVIGHHVGFDLEWFERECRRTVNVRRVLDTGVLYHHTQGHVMPSLKFLQDRHGEGYQYLIPDPGTWDGAEEMALYNAEDVIHPWRLFHDGVGDLDPDQLKLYLKVAGRSELYLQRMTANGIYFLHDNWRQTKEALEKRRKEIVEDWREEDPDAKILISSVHTWEGPDQRESVFEGTEALRTYLYDVKDMPVERTTEKTDAPATDKDTLQILRNKTGADFLDRIADIRKIESLLQKKVWRFPEKHVEPDGRVHSAYRNTKTSSGRWSSTKPNVQNVPRDDTVPGDGSIRSHFGVPHDRVYLSADLSQIELRIMLCLAGDEAAIKAYREGTDGHITTASRMTGKPPEAITKEERTLAKPVNFGLVYGGDAGTLQAQAREYGMEWSWEKCERWTKKYFQEWYPSLPTYHDKVIHQLRANDGVIQDPTGMVHRYPKWDHPKDSVRKHWERTAINAMGQGPAHFITSRIGILAQQRFREDGLFPHSAMTINTIHDSVEIETTEDDYEDVIDILEWATRRTKPWIEDWFLVPLVMDFEVGPNWSELEEIDYSAAA